MPLPPRITPGQAEEIAAAHYGISAVAQRLAAEHDDTFRLTAADGTVRLLKIAVDSDSDSGAGAAAASPLLAEVRGAGLYLGADVVDPATGDPSGARAAAIVNGMRDRRVLISATGPLGHTLKIRPPLPFSRANADHLLEVLTDTPADQT